MTDSFSNDNDAARQIGTRPDAYGQAALFLVESVLHGLIEQSVFSVDQAIELVRTAAEVQGAVGADLGDSPATLRRSLALLEAISTSLQGDRRP